MKKIFAIPACIALCLSMSACTVSISSSKNDSSDDISSDVSSVESVESDEVESDEYGSYEKTTLESYVNSEEFQSQIEEITESYESQGISVKVTARGNALVYTYQYTVDVDVEAARESIDEVLSGEVMKDTFSGVLNEVKPYVTDLESVIVEYLDKEGNLITSYEYK